MTGANHDEGGPVHSPGASPEKPFRTVANLAGLSVVGVVFLALAALTWRKWPDPIIDFGTQLYIPWRLNEGAVLYRDLFYLGGGPVSQYFNALLFKIFGASFSTLIAANLIFSAALLGFIYHRFLKASDTLTATMICLGIVVVFIFSGYTAIGNYNYIAPYAHEAVHGIILSLLAVGWLADWLTKQKLRPAMLAGFCAGLVFMTKPDIFVALFACAAAALALHWLHRREIRFALKSVAGFGLALLLPPLFFFLFFLRVEDWQTSLRSVVFGWVPVFLPAVRNNPYYIQFSGLDYPAAHLREMATHFLCAMLAIALYAVLFRGMNRWKIRQLESPWTVWLILVLPLLIWSWVFPWVLCGSSLPLWCLTILLLLGWRLKQTPDAPSLKFLFLWTVFALVVMAKLGLYARIWHYGFVLAMPAFVITIYFLLWLLPRLLEDRYQVPAKYLRGAFLLIMLAAFTLLFNYSNHLYRAKGQPIGRGGDTIVTFGPGMDIGDDLKISLDLMDKTLPADATLSVLPAGVTLNYLTRRVNPTPCLFWEPVVMAVFGQATMTARFEATPPDYVILVEQEHSAFGVHYLGSTPGYGVELMQWIKKNYQPVVVVGNELLRDGRFGLELFKHLPPSPAPK